MAKAKPFKVGVTIHPQQCTIQELRAAWRHVDELGVDSIWFWDHFFPLYGDPDAASIVFNAGWMVTMIGSDVGERTLITRKYLADLQALHGPESDFIAKLADFYLTRSEKSGYQGAAMYYPLAVATVIDPSLVTLKDMHVDVETKGEFTRGETVANRMGSDERNVLHGDHYEIEGVIELKPNARVCLASDADRFLQLFISRIRGK